MVLFNNWSIIVDISICGDCLVPFGSMEGRNDRYEGRQAIPGHFVSLDRVARTAKSIGGTEYEFGEFCPNGNAKTEEEAFDFLAAHWMKREK